MIPVGAARCVADHPATIPPVRHLASRAFFGPPDWLIGMIDARARRAFGFWTLILAIIGAFFFGRQVLYVTVLSVVALIPNFSSETPVEVEGLDVDVEHADKVEQTTASGPKADTREEA